VSAFDPWTATFEEALEAETEAERQRPGSDYEPDRSISQWAAAQHIVDHLRDRVESGDGNAAMDAVAQCVRSGLIAPDWLARKFLRCYDSVLNCRVASWDQAFGAPFPPRAKLEVWRLRRRMRWQLLAFFRAPDAPPRTAEGWKAAAAALGITPKQAKEWTPKTRSNTKGHKPYRKSTTASAEQAHDPFGLATPKEKPR